MWQTTLTHQGADKMNPTFLEFEDKLKELTDNNHSEQKIILVSASNPKDIAHLAQQLTDNNQAVEYSLNRQLIKINGIPLHLTYVTQQTKVELITSMVQIYTAHYKPSLFNGMKPDIKYVCRENNLLDPNLKELKDELDAINASLSEKINVITWTKNQSLSDALKEVPAPQLKLN